MDEHQPPRDAVPEVPSEPPQRRRRSGPVHRALAALREGVVVVVASVVLSLLVKTFLVQAFFIPSISMENTLLVGDRILVSRLTPGPFDLQRGDIVVFEDPGGWLKPAPQVSRGPVLDAVETALTFVGLLPQTSDQHLVKRVIGLPGDSVACCDEQGRTTVNGAPLTEDFLKPGSIPSQVTFSVVVPPGSIWVEGDNRQNSGDSRFHLGDPGGGMVPVDDVVGRAVVTVWPLDRLTWLSRHAEVFADVPASASTGSGG
ncbi:signal peptidase I [Quadrisphaera granulorum]|uniref:Signal peptidase I n=1 Tax=Quadrisphaera granulorum TaxID=317664 RepID=A0A315ZQE0_9ACTN|nr:signal peptidase I [Quadrisphaera granulorum]PWJ47200.1 signal peptidase I [Quadrisphaera granulorum]SZE98886.1 signal peptidase I [Quadrisphaera granulorum]